MPPFPSARAAHFQIGTPSAPSAQAFGGFGGQPGEEENWEMSSQAASHVSDVAVLVNELREARLQEAKGREEDRAARAKELELLAHRKEPGSIFKITPQADFPIFGDKDTDVDAHMEDFEDLCNLANPVGGVSGLGKALAGDRLR